MRFSNRKVHTLASRGKRSQQVGTYPALDSECLLESLTYRSGYLRAVSIFLTYTLLPLHCKAYSSFILSLRNHASIAALVIP